MRKLGILLGIILGIFFGLGVIVLLTNLLFLYTLKFKFYPAAEKNITAIQIKQNDATYSNISFVFANSADKDLRQQCRH